jgi:hypothetical protein
MDRTSKYVAIAAAIVLGLYVLVSGTLLTIWIAGWPRMHARSSDELLSKLALAKPGVHLSDIRGQLGPEMRVASDTTDILAWGDVKNESFCKGKKLYIFRATAAPYRTVEVYTDPDDIVVYATWGSL